MTQVVEQGTAEWLQQRCGKITASRFCEPLKKPRTKSANWSVAAESYALELVGERLTGRVAGGGSSAATEWGNEQEEPARLAYEAEHDEGVSLAAFVEHPLVDHVGGSCDGLLGDTGIIEIKCPYTSRVHVATLLSGQMPPDHAAQVQGLLWVTDREYCDFVSFDPRMPEGSQLFVRRVERDEAFITELAERIEAFAAYVTELEGIVRG